MRNPQFKSVVTCQSADMLDSGLLGTSLSQGLHVVMVNLTEGLIFIHSDEIKRNQSCR